MRRAGLILVILLALPASSYGDSRHDLDEQVASFEGRVWRRSRSVRVKPGVDRRDGGRLDVTLSIAIEHPPLPVFEQPSAPSNDPIGRALRAARIENEERDQRERNQLLHPTVLLRLADGRELVLHELLPGHQSIWTTSDEHQVESIDGAVLKVQLRYWEDSKDLLWPINVIATLDDVREALGLARQVYADLAEIDDLPEGFRTLVAYRLGLLERFFAFDAILRSQRVLAIDGALGGRRPLIDRDVLLIGVAYMDLVAQPIPIDVSPRINEDWREADGALIFRSPREFDAITHALAQSEVIRTRNVVSATLEGLMGTAFVGVTTLPGGTLFWSAKILASGSDIDGRAATWLDRVFAAADIAFDGGPIIGGLVRANLRIATGRMARSLEKYLADRNALRRQLAGAGEDRLLKEAVQTRWLDDLDRLVGREGITLPTQRQGFGRTDGRILPQPGIDRVVLSRIASGAWDTVREYKRLTTFDGKWSRSSTSLSDTRVKIEGLHRAPVGATQNSWSWIVDRGMKAYRFAKNNNLEAELRGSRELLEKFRDGKLRRTLVVMTDEGQIFFSTERILGELCEEALNPATGAPVTLAELRTAVANFLQSQP